MKILLALLLVLTAASPAFSQTLAEKKQMEKWQASLSEDSSAKGFKEKCGYDLPVKLSDNLVTPFMEQNADASSFCNDVRRAMVSMCEDTTTKEAIAAKVKALSCEYKKDDAKGTFALSPEGTLSFGFDSNVPNIPDAAKAYLEGNL